jgi:hypothetical protein
MGQPTRLIPATGLFVLALLSTGACVGPPDPYTTQSRPAPQAGGSATSSSQPTRAGAIACLREQNIEVPDTATRDDLRRIALRMSAAQRQRAQECLNRAKQQTQPPSPTPTAAPTAAPSQSPTPGQSPAPGAS